MNTETLKSIREAERESHLEIYSTAKLFESGSWLQKPVKTVPSELFIQAARLYNVKIFVNRIFLYICHLTICTVICIIIYKRGGCIYEKNS